MKTIPILPLLLFLLAESFLVPLPAATGAPPPDPPMLAEAKAGRGPKEDPAEMARKAGKPVVADFTLGMCRKCKEQALVLEEVRKQYGDRIVVRIVATQREPKLVDKYEVSTVPLLVFFDAAGKAVARFEGEVAPKAKIEKQLATMGVAK